MSGWLIALAIVLALLVGWLYVDAARADRVAREWEERASSAEDFAEEQQQRADSTMELVDEYQRLADSVAVVTVTTVDTLRIEVERARLVEVPDTCRQLVAQRDSLIDEYDYAARSWSDAYARQMAANVELRSTVTTLRTGLDSLEATIASRPKPRSRWLPALRPGVFAGMCADGPCYGAGLTLSWRL